MPQTPQDIYNPQSNFDIAKQPDYKQFLQWQKAQQPTQPQVQPQTRAQAPQGENQFKDINTNVMDKKGDELFNWMPNSVRAFAAGGLDNITSYAQSADKFFHSKFLHNVAHAVAPTLTDATTAVADKAMPNYFNATSNTAPQGEEAIKEKLAYMKQIAHKYEKGHTLATLGGKILLDPVNFTPAGVYNDGRKLYDVGKSVLAGAAIGAGTTVAKEYGDTNGSSLTKDALIGSGLVGTINGIISLVTKGRLKDVIPESAIPKDATPEQATQTRDAILNSLTSNPTAFGLNKEEAQQAAQKISDFKPSPLSASGQAPLTKEQALNILARKANANLIKEGKEPIYPLINADDAPTQLTPSEAHNIIANKQNAQAINAGDEPTFNEMPPSIDPSTSIDTPLAVSDILAHPRLDELLNMREDIKPSDLGHDNILVAKGGARELDGYNGTEKMAYDKNLLTKNYAKDMDLTGKDVAQIKAGNITPDLQEKLTHDLGVMDNNPDYAPEHTAALEQFKDELKKLNEDTTPNNSEDLIGKPDNLSDKDWELANTLFAKHIDNLAVGAYYGLGQDKNGNITFNPEKFIIGLGGYSALKYALSRDLIKGKLKELALDAIDRVNFNPEVQKGDKGISAMFTSPRDAGDGVFSDLATRKTMQEIDDKDAKFNLIPHKDIEIDGRYFTQPTAKLSEVLDHPELYKRYPELKDLTVAISNGGKEKGSYSSLLNMISIDKRLGYDAISDNEIRSTIKRLKDKQNNLLDHPIDEEFKRIDDLMMRDNLSDEDYAKYGELYQNTPTYKRVQQLEKRIIDLEKQGGKKGFKLTTAGQKTLLHEIQHAIQEQEGWAKGGNPDMFKMTPLEIKQNEWSSIILSEAKNEKEVREFLKEWSNDAMSSDYSSKDISVLQELKKATNPHELLKKWEKRAVEPRESEHDSYKRLHGEQLARATQYRKDMTPEERQKESWTDTLKRIESNYKEPIIRYSGGKALSKADDEKDLLIHHNLTQDNLRHADDMGGVAVPSLAITKKDNPLDGFGDVTLLGDKELANPKKDHKIYGADIYSPRYPRAENKLKATDIRKIVNELQPYSEMAGKYGEVNTDDLENEIGLKLKFLEGKGDNINKLIKYDEPTSDAIDRYKELKSFYKDGLMNRDYANNPKFVEKVKEILKSKIGSKVDDWTDTQINRVAKTYAAEMKSTLKKLKKGSSPDYYATRAEISNIINNKYKTQFKRFVKDYYKSHNAEEKIYNGTDSQGRQKWQAHTLDNVVKKLKKDLRGGENFNYGTGSLRAKFTPEFKTLAAIKKNKGRLVTSDEFKKAKKEVEDEYLRLKDDFQEHHENKSYDFERTFNGLIEDSINSPIERELKDYGFKNVPQELISELENFKKILRDMPTEYFESKVLRAMDLKEFKHAIIPNDASKETKDILKKNGISYTEYDKDLPQDRVNKIKKTAEKNNYLFANGMHSLAGGFFGGADSLINQRDYNGDGKYNYKDLLLGVATGAISITALEKLAPKLFEEEADNGVKAGLFAGSKAKGFKDAEQAGKTFDGKYDGLKRFEIDDSKASLKATPKELSEATRKRLAQDKADIMKQYKDGTFSEEEAKKLLDKNFLDMPSGNDGTYKLSQVLDHKELFDNYPKLYDAKVTFTEMPKGANGYFDKNSNEIVLNSNMSEEKIKSSLLHEIQHVIQKKEGFARGGSAQEFYNDAKRKIDLLKYELDFEPDEFIRDKKLKQLNELETTFNNGYKEKAYDMYKRLAGEIEARDVQARADLTAEQRAKIEPYSSEDIKPEDAILKFSNSKEGQLNMQEDVNGFKANLNKQIKTASTKGFKHIQKIIGDEASKEWGDASSMVKRLFTDTLGAEYHKVRQDNVTAINGYSVKAERMHYALAKLSEEDRRSIHKYIIGDTKAIPQHLKELADNVRDTISSLGRKLVENKVLSQEAYDDWKGHYLYRTYDRGLGAKVQSLMKKGFKIDEIFARGKTEIKTEAEMKKLLASPKFLAKTQKKLYDGGVKFKILPDGKYEVRRDWTPQERAEMKEITDGAITIPQTLIRMNRMLENANMLRQVKDMDKVVLSPLHEKHFTHDEIDAMGYAKAPKSPKFGVLAGRYVRKDVLNDIKARNDEIFNTLNGADGALARLWLGYLRVWKKSKTVWNAPSHVNNFLSNFYLMHLAGMKAHEIIPAVGRAGMAIAKGNRIEEALQNRLIGTATKEDKELLANMGDSAKYYLEAKDNGVLGRSQLNDILRGETRASGKGILSKIDRFTENAYHNGDAVNRVAMFTLLRKKYGMSIDEAKNMTLAVMPDYTKPMPMGYKFLRDSGISPFISWTYYTTPIIFKMMKTKQGAAKLALALGSIEGLQWALTGGAVSPLSDLPEVSGNKPDSFKGRRFAISMANGNVNTIKMDKWIPYIGMVDPENFLLGNFSGPTVNAGVNLGTTLSRQGAIDPYTGRPIARKSASTGKSIYKHIKYIAEHYAPIPSELTGIYNTIEAKVLSKKSRRNSSVIVPRTATQETVKNLGLNTLTYSLPALQQQKQKEQLKALKKVMGL